MEITPLINEDFVVLQDEATLSELIGKLKQYEKHSALVFRKGKYLGIVEKKKVIRSRVDAKEMKIKHFVQKTPVISEHEDIISVAYLMFESNLDFVPVQRNKTIIGVVRAVDVAKAAAELPETKGFKVEDCKLLKPSKLHKNAPLATAMEIMHDEHLDQVPVFDEGKIYGIISYKDVLRRYLNWSPKRDVSANFNRLTGSRAVEAEVSHIGLLPVSSFSTNDNLITIAAQGYLKDAVNLMVKNNIMDVLVLARDEFKGLLTVKNILRLVGSLKIPQNYNIQFVDLNKMGLEQYQKVNVQKICSNEAFKLQRVIRDDFMLVLHFKEYQKDARQHKYSIHLRIEYPGKIITASGDDWDMETALHIAFEAAKTEAQKMFQGESSKKYKQIRK